MSILAEDTSTLEEDAALDEPLRRVAYEAGMMLGLEATRDEQAYHRLRLNRHQYWLHGSGTLTGMVVALDPASSSSTDPVLTRITVSPGIGIDGLGREVLINEGYCIDLGAWLKTRTELQLREGYDEAENLLWLKVTVRYRACAVAAQPVLARKLNLSSDAVQPSRSIDSIALELSTELPPAEDDRYRPWPVHEPVEDALPAALTPAEQDTLTAAEAADPDSGRQLQLHARLLYALQEQGVSARVAADQLEEGARLLLARLSIQVTDLNSILDADENDQVVNPNDISVNNLLRPFLVTASQLAYLQRSS